MNLSPQEGIVVTIAVIAAAAIAYFFVAAVQDGHRGLQGAAAVAFCIFAVVGVVSFLRAV